MENNNTFLGTEPLGRLMRKYALPCVISLLVAALYNIVDQIFIANASYLGAYGNAANTVVFPLTVVALAVAVMIGDGCCAFVSLCQGAREEGKASRSVGSAVVLSVISGMFIMLVYLLFSDGILTLFGGHINEETFQQSQIYFFWISLGIPFYMFGQAMNPIIRADGNPRFAMISTLAGAVVNMVLDPLFIFVFRWGMMGAAAATVMGQVLTAALAVWYLFHMKTIELERDSFVPRGQVIRRFLPLGACSLLSQLSLVMAMMAIQNMIVVYGARDEVFGQAEYAHVPMAVLGIVMKVFQIVIGIVVGMAAGCIPVAGFNVGAGLYGRAKKLFSMLLGCEFAVGVAALLIVEILPHRLIGIFGASGESSYYTEFAVRSFRVYLCMMPLATVNKAAFIYMQAMGRAAASTMLSLVREVLFGVGLALLLPVYFGLNGVLYSMPVSDVLTFVISAIVIAQTYRQLSRPNAALER